MNIRHPTIEPYIVTSFIGLESERITLTFNESHLVMIRLYMYTWACSLGGWHKWIHGRRLVGVGHITLIIFIQKGTYFHHMKGMHAIGGWGLRSIHLETGNDSNTAASFLKYTNQCKYKCHHPKDTKENSLGYSG